MPITSKPMATMPDDAHDYICDLEEQVKDAWTELQKAIAELSAKQSRYSKTLDWLKQLKIYCEAIDKTNLCAETLLGLLENAINQASIVGDAACFGVDDLRYLVVDVETVSCCTEKLRDKVEDLKNQFPTLDPSDPISVAYKNLQDAIAEAIKCIKEALNLLLNTLEEGEILWKGLADSSDSPGLKGYLEMLEKTFKTGELHQDYTPCPNSSCSSIKFPLDDNGNPYYDDTLKECDTVEDEIYKSGGLRDQVDAAQRNKNAKQTCYDALKAALEAASAAKACKK